MLKLLNIPRVDGWPLVCCRGDAFETVTIRARGENERSI